MQRTHDPATAEGANRLLAAGLAMAAALALLWLSGCDVLEQKTTNSRYAGTYVAEDSLVLRFTPSPLYDEQNDPFSLPDTSINLLDQGGSLRLTLKNTGSTSANKGSVRGRLVIPDSITIPADQSFRIPPLNPRRERAYFKLAQAGTETQILADSSQYVGVVDRVATSLVYRSSTAEVDSTVPGGRIVIPVPARWRFNPEGGTLKGTTSEESLRSLSRTILARGESGTLEKTTITLGTLSLDATLHRK